MCEAALDAFSNTEQTTRDHSLPQFTTSVVTTQSRRSHAFFFKADV